MSEERGGGWYNDPSSEEGDENRREGAPVKRAAIPGSLIDKLLNNPHAALRRGPQRCRLPADTKHQKRRVGEQVAMGQTSLMVQHPLLDGGEGELLPRSDYTKLDTHDEQRISPTGATTSSLPPSGFPALDASNLSGLEPPRLDSTGGVVTGADIPKHRIENKRRRKATLADQAMKSQWTIDQGEFELPVHPTPLERHRGQMCP
jgi:hypothetical protein